MNIDVHPTRLPLLRTPPKRRSALPSPRARVAIVCLMGLAASCKVSSPVVPEGRDSYHVSSHVAACISCSAYVKSLQTANEYCASRHLNAVVRNFQNVTNPFGYIVGNDMTFSCVSDSDPEFKRPDVRKDNGITTLEQRRQ